MSKPKSILSDPWFLRDARRQYQREKKAYFEEVLRRRKVLALLRKGVRIEFEKPK